MDTEHSVARSYTHGSLEATILGALAASGKDIDRLTIGDLAPVDEFHIGGRQATIDFTSHLTITPTMRLLDIGSGIGGASRYLVHTHGCHVTGIDLTDEYVRVAQALAARVGLHRSVTYRQGSALSLPFAPDSFDGATMLHVGMNIADKAVLFREVRRVLRPGAFFGIYDVMRDGEGDLAFPVPWALGAETSFLETAAMYRRLLEEAGFLVEHERGRRDFAVAFFAQLRARMKAGTDAPSVGLHMLMGPTGPQKIANMVANIDRGLIAPVELIARAA
ncbi:MAG: class I SAM-dependent methyltransferase [Acetobacteraceae bacterium]